MKVSSTIALLLPVVAARFVESVYEQDHVQLHPEQAAAEQFLIELSPGKTRWVTEDEKWELRRVSCLFSFISFFRCCLPSGFSEGGSPKLRSPMSPPA